MAPDLESEAVPHRAVSRAAAIGAMLLAPLVFRGLLLAKRTSGVTPDDLRGVAADVAVSLLALAAVYTAARASRALGAALVLIWCIAQYVNHEVVAALGSLASLLDAHFLTEPAFLLGSGLAISEPLWLLFVTGAALALARLAVPRLRPRDAVVALVVAAVLLGTLSFGWRFRLETAAWRQTHFIAYDAARVARRIARPTDLPSHFADAPTAMLDLLPSLGADVNAPTRFALPREKRNVLLVILESVSGLHMQSLSSEHGVSIPSLAPELDAIAKRHLSYSTFFVHQRRTNKGLYSILCGELPNLVDALPKMSAYQDGGRACLPEVLRDAGYHTVYLQAAPLAFMLKDQFMPRIGFEDVLGDEFFEGGYARTAWGLDDRAFFEQSLSKIRELQAREEPWMLTMLTVGTHHPYVVPEGYRPDLGSEIARALHYADDATARFDRALDELGIPEDTLILYTSDESVGFDGAIQKLDQMIVKGWGFLIARTPEGLQARVDEPFGQMDLALSTLDYLGLADRGRHFFGRSVFRHYEEPRHVFFANSNSDFNAMLHPDGHLALCMLDFESCRAYAVRDGQVFGRRRRQISWDSATDGLLEQMARRSVNPVVTTSSREFTLVRQGSPLAIDRSEKTFVHGGQYVTLEAGDWIEVELEVEAHGDGTAELSHLLQYPPEQRPYREQIDIPAGKTLRLRYTFAPGARVPDLDVRSAAGLRDGSGVRLNFETARLTVHRTGAPAAGGVSVLLLEVTDQP